MSNVEINDENPEPPEQEPPEQDQPPPENKNKILPYRNQLKEIQLIESLFDNRVFGEFPSRSSSFEEKDYKDYKDYKTCCKDSRDNRSRLDSESIETESDYESESKFILFTQIKK